MAANPMTQFEVYRIGPEVKLGSFDISFTNASLFMVISSLAILIIFNLGSKKNSMIPNKIQLLSELSYTFVSKMISDTAGSKAKPYFAFIFSLFSIFFIPSLRPLKILTLYAFNLSGRFKVNMAILSISEYKTSEFKEFIGSLFI